ncbi:MAG: hypothetical protein KF803_13030 [Cyclobacteriaceae bacterium]|nr:hypothetical protein [Cyclobacteriaceae bacterium]
MKLQTKIVFLWMLVILGMLLHQFFSLHNLRFGVNVIKNGYDAVPDMEMIKRLGLYLLPTVYMLGIMFVETRIVRLLAFAASLFYSAFHSWHFIDELGKMKDWVQWVLLTLIIVYCLILNLASWKWYREEDKR